MARSACPFRPLPGGGATQYPAGMFRRFGMLLLAASAAIAGAVACGGGDDEDDFEDIRATATAAAAATPSPSPGPTQDPTIPYYSQALALANELAELVNKLDADMLAAQSSQADPKWPQLLTADADLVIAKAKHLDSLTVPGGVPETLRGKIRQACDGLAAGADLLKQAILKLDPAIGQESASTLDAGENVLEDVRAELQRLTTK